MTSRATASILAHSNTVYFLVYVSDLALPLMLQGGSRGMNFQRSKRLLSPFLLSISRFLLLIVVFSTPLPLVDRSTPRHRKIRRELHQMVRHAARSHKLRRTHPGFQLKRRLPSRKQTKLRGLLNTAKCTEQAVQIKEDF